VSEARGVRIAMWSGPRNLSTALMRSFGARGDCACSDEPLYAHYLAATGIDHPGRDAVIASQPTDWRVATEALAGPVPDGKPLWYQKHMIHHLLPGMGRDWMAGLRHAFLIRSPREVIASYVRTRPDATPEDFGFPQQEALFRHVTEDLGQPAVVVDAADLLADPPRVLAALCSALGVAYTDRMLSWPPGPQPYDGVWGPHWYAGVWQSTGFAAPRTGDTTLPPGHDALLAAGERAYAPLWDHRLR